MNNIVELITEDEKKCFGEDNVFETNRNYKVYDVAVEVEDGKPARVII